MPTPISSLTPTPRTAMRRSGHHRYGVAPGAWIVAMVVFGLTAFGTVRPAFSQTPNPVTLKGVFDPDLADVTPDGLKQLQKVVNDVKANATCFPPRVTLKVHMKAGGDPLFLKTLAMARLEALRKSLASLGLEPDQIQPDKIKPADYDITTPNEDVQVSFGPFNTDGKDGPILKVDSEPPKGTKVKAGDQINVTMRASERYEDGHKQPHRFGFAERVPCAVGILEGSERWAQKGDWGAISSPTNPGWNKTWSFTYTPSKAPPH